MELVRHTFPSVVGSDAPQLVQDVINIWADVDPKLTAYAVKYPCKGKIPMLDLIYRFVETPINEWARILWAGLRDKDWPEASKFKHLHVVFSRKFLGSVPEWGFNQYVEWASLAGASSVALC